MTLQGPKFQEPYDIFLDHFGQEVQLQDGRIITAILNKEGNLEVPTCLRNGLAAQTYIKANVGGANHQFYVVDIIDKHDGWSVATLVDKGIKHGA